MSRDVDGRGEGLTAEEGKKRHIRRGKDHKGTKGVAEREEEGGEERGKRGQGPGFGLGEGGSRFRTCIDIHSKGVFLVSHQAVGVILGHDAKDVILQFGVEVKVDGSDIGNDSAWLCGFQHTHCLDRVEELGAGVIDVVDQDGDGGCA